MKPLFIYFDLDDTLVNTKETIIKRIEFALKKHKMEVSVSEIYNLLAEQDRGEILQQRTTKSSDFWNYYEKLREEVRVSAIRGAIQSIERLFTKKIPMGVITNNSHNKALQKLLYSGFDPSKFILGIHGFDNLGYKKPSPRIYESIKQDPLVCTYIGDSLEDFEFSRNSGADFIGVCTGVHSREDFTNKGLEDNKILNSVKEIHIIQNFFQ